MPELRTYRAKSLAEALRLVREDLGPDASLLHTRQVGNAAWPWQPGGLEVEVTASCEVQAPSRLPPLHSSPAARADLLDFRSQFRRHLLLERSGNAPSIEELATRVPSSDHAGNVPSRIR